MSVPAPQSLAWYLLKHEDQSIFGPAPFDQLRLWAAEAQVSPLDRVSTDQTSWLRAPMLPDLDMDWLVEVTAEHCYGPTTLGAVRDFLLRGEIGPETVLINARDGSRQRVEDIPELMVPPEEEEPPNAGDPGFSSLEAPEAAVTKDLPQPGIAPAAEMPPPEPNRTGIRFHLQQRIRELESSLIEERRLLTDLSYRYAELEAKYIKLLGHQRAGGETSRAQG